MQIEEKLKQAGLSGNEAKVYVALLKSGSINGSRLAKILGLDRTVTYQVLSHLIEKGLASSIVRENKKYFSPTKAENLFKRVDEERAIIARLIPELSELEKTKEEDESVTVYEGKAGLRALYRELSHTNNFCFFGGTGKSYDLLLEMPLIVKNTMKKVKGRGIADETKRNLPFSKIKNLEMRYLKNAESKDTATGILEDGRVTIHSLAQEKPIVIIIKNKAIAETYKNYFEILWNIAKP